jgi:hypothetical protein
MRASNSGEPTPEFTIYAAGPGLWLASDGVLGLVPEGNEQRATRELIDSQALIQFRTGSPQLLYRISLRSGDEVRMHEGRYLGATTFGWRLEGTTVVIRDGYDRLLLAAPSPDTLCIPWPAGYYRTTVGWLRPERHGEMVLHFGLERTDEAIPSDGAVDLDFVA